MEPIGTWFSPSAHELRIALSRADALIDKYLCKTYSGEWLKQLEQCLSLKTKNMERKHNGFEFYMRFKATYGAVHHLGTASIWRNAEGELVAAVLHQESLPPTKKVPVMTGRVFNTFDTSLVLGKMAPVESSMQFVGLPDVNVFPVAYPHYMTIANINTTKQASRDIFF
ncbi:MAG: hypothetical protein K2Z81_06705 [Cyanobacteria bacterium]|nr:hypothetical protein [Cyanobacteriota bacterium]